MATPPGLLEESFNNLLVTRYCSIAAGGLWIWDTIITFDEEVHLLWSRNGRAIKALYLANRYLMILGVFSLINAIIPVTGASRVPNSGCRARVALLFLCELFQSVVSSTIFILRLHVVYSGRKSVQRMLVGTLVLFGIASVVLYALVLSQMLPGIVWDPISQTCHPPFSKWRLVGSLIISILIDSIVYLATLAHAIQFAGVRVVMKRTRSQRIFHTLYVEGSIYYLLMIGIRLTALLFMFLSPSTIQLIFFNFSYTVSSVLTSRWFLHFRREILKLQSDIPASDTMTGPAIPFSPQSRPGRSLSSRLSEDDS